MAALHRINLSLKPHGVLGLVGPSGAGKTTLVKIIAGLEHPSHGRATYAGEPISVKNRAQRKKIQIIWQNAALHLNPYMRVQELIAEPLKLFRAGEKKQHMGICLSLLGEVGLSSALLKRRPYELSGGQAQRLAIARAMAAGPELLICDEPFAGLDLLGQAEILNLLKKLHRKNQLNLLIIAHDMRCIKSLCTEAAVLDQGEIIEQQEIDNLFRCPLKLLTKELLQASFILPFKMDL
jgi:ABC-type dipeptide/oligopeptide/nickel transport system ATPase subunit